MADIYAFGKNWVVPPGLKNALDPIITAGDSSTLNAAKSYTDVSATAIKNHAENYTNGAIEAASAKFMDRGVLPPASSPNDYRMLRGVWTATTESVMGGTGWPTGFTSGVLVSFGYTGAQMAFSYSTKPIAVWRSCTSASAETWTNWLDLMAAPVAAGTSELVPVTYHAEERAARVADALLRVGGKIGTGGRAAVMLRFDDYPDTMMSKVVPVLEKYDLPSYWAATVNHVENLSSVSWATLNTTAIQTGVQMTGHSWTHGNATTPAGVHKEIVESADYFEQMMPATRIDLWTQPSVGGAVPYDVGDGGYAGKTPKDLYGTHAGRLLLSRYPVINGARPGFYHPMGGGVDAALLTANLTYESMTFDNFKTYVDEIVLSGSATDLMLHPGRLDTTGYMTSTTFDQCMAYLAQLRIDGKLLIASGLAKAALDSDSSYRHDLLRGSFADGSRAGWSKGVSTDGVLSVSAVDQTIRSCHVDRYTGMRGSVREFVAVVRSTAENTIQLEAKALDGSFTVAKSYTVPAGGGWQEIRKVFMVPYNLGSTYVQFGIKSTTSAAFEVREAHAYAL